MLSVAAASAQDINHESSGQGSGFLQDTSQVALPTPSGDTLALAPETTLADTTMSDTSAVVPPAPETYLSPGDTTKFPMYDERKYVSTGPASEIRHFSYFFSQSPGPVGSPVIPVSYLNVVGVDITVNGMPFLYQGIYRPFLMGVDINTIPWEILNDIRLTPSDPCPSGLDFGLGKPPDLANRSDVEIDRGPYGYSGSRWRFFRPFGKKTYAYFTVGFKKSDGYIENSDYNGYHVAAGLTRKIRRGQLSLDFWRHKAKGGVNSLDFVVSQLHRQSRGIDRMEIKYDTPLKAPFSLGVTGLYQRNAQTISGYVPQSKTKLEIAGGQVNLSDSLANACLNAGFDYYRLKLYGLAGIVPSINLFNYSAGLIGQNGQLDYMLSLSYAWNGLDHGAFLPEMELSYEFSPIIKPFVSAYRTRQAPDLYLRYCDDFLPDLGIQGFLSSYLFESDAELSTPVTSLASIGMQSDFGPVQTRIGISQKWIDSQIQLAYNADTASNFTVSPINFDDRFLEVYGIANGSLGPLSLELSGVYRKWHDPYFADNLEKGPAALGFARFSYRRQFFIPRLFLGASVESRFSSRRDYRSFAPGFTDAFAVVLGRVEFQYKDLSFYLSEENITNAGYITWWPYYEAPRILWWGLRWRFFD